MPSIRLPLCLLALSAALPSQSAVAPTSYDYGIDRGTIVKRQTSQIYAVTGINTGGGPVPVRQEIRQLELDDLAWTLYILGVDMLQYTNQTEMLSWYQIAGIHGQPYEPFDGVQPTSGNANNGYCTHVSILFPTWHRPYLALYEQVLYGIIQQIASLWPAGLIQDQYVAAAANFRIPYWDWAAVPPAGQSIVPPSVYQSATMIINGPNGQQVIANPLYTYQFKPLDPNQLQTSPWSVFPTTMRYPTTQNTLAVSQNDLMAQTLDKYAEALRSRLLSLFSNYQDYATFSNEAWIPQNNPEGFDSIESIHDLVHGLTGGNNGHMSYIEYSAFDPIFFLHHAMIDRCFAMWQVLYPDSYVVPEPAKYSTFTNSAGETQDSSTNLTPFYEDANGDFWTSDSVRSTETFGYAYPETANSLGVNFEAQVVSAINSLYGTKAPTASKRDLGGIFNRDPEVQNREWIANIKVEKTPFPNHFSSTFSLVPLTPHHLPLGPAILTSSARTLVSPRRLPRSVRIVIRTNSSRLPFH